MSPDRGCRGVSFLEVTTKAPATVEDYQLFVVDGMMVYARLPGRARPDELRITLAGAVRIRWRRGTAARSCCEPTRAIRARRRASAVRHQIARTPRAEPAELHLVAGGFDDPVPADGQGSGHSAIAVTRGGRSEGTVPLWATAAST